MRISDWSSDVCSSDLIGHRRRYDHSGTRNGRRSSIAGSVSRTGTRGWLDSARLRDPVASPPAWALDELAPWRLLTIDRKSVVLGKSVSGCVDLRGRRIIKKKT